MNNRVMTGGLLEVPVRQRGYTLSLQCLCVEAEKEERFGIIITFWLRRELPDKHLKPPTDYCFCTTFKRNCLLVQMSDWFKITA